MFTKPLSIYIHIPFCAGKCRYCDFFSIRFDSDLADAYINALVAEWELVCSRLGFKDPIIETLFFGGGTPSLLSERQWLTINDALLSRFHFSGTMEWTVECNPDSFSENKALLFREIGVNRVSIGVQSLQDTELLFSGRKHTSSGAMEVLHSEALGGFDSVGVDLIYGLPLQTISSLRDTIERVVALPRVNHVSVYELTLNDTTPFGRHRQLLPLPHEDDVLEMTRLVSRIAEQNGFEQYEISNYAKAAYRCRHNEIYWDHRPYIGLGCAAHSYIHPYRWANQHSISAYIDSLRKGDLPVAEREEIDSETLAREMLFLGLRRIDGIDEERFFQNTGKSFQSWVNGAVMRRLIQEGWIRYQKPRWRTTQEGMLIADALARDLFPD